MNSGQILANNSSALVSIDSLFSTGQVRLAELSVYNWGSFNGLSTVRIDPEGTLITGDNGSGKSTIIDALMALLLPAKNAAFNAAAAQGNTSDRSLVSYMRGTYGSDQSGSEIRVKNKRDGAVCSAIRAHYRADDDSEITLAAMFFISANCNSVAEVERIYIAAKRNLPLKELLDTFGNGEKRKLKQILRNDPTLKMFDNKFSTYQEYYFTLLQIENRNAPNLLSRALGLKKIDNLTNLIRDMVLEPNSLRDDAKKVVDEFEDLVTIYKQLIDAKKQVDALSDLPQARDSFLEADKSVTEIKELLENLGIFFGEQTSVLWRQKLDTVSEQLYQKRSQQNVELQIKKDLEDQRDRYYQSYLKAGGSRIETVKKELVKEQERLKIINAKAADYQSVAEFCGLEKTLQETQFKKNQLLAEEKLNHLEVDNSNAMDQFGNLSGLLNEQISQQKTLEKDINDLKSRPGSSIDPAYQRLKNVMIDSLGVNSDDFVFIGEIIDVKDDDEDWRGAIERALGGRSTTLLVPARTRSMVSQWLNQQHTGLFVRVEEVSETQNKAVAFSENGFLRKLQWKKHPYRDWLKHRLSRFDLTCVENTKELDATEFSMTKEGLIRRERGRLEKNDTRKVDDRQYWNIGFSNTSRLQQMTQEMDAYSERISTLSLERESAKKTVEDLSDHKRNLERLFDFKWNEIDANYCTDLINLYKEEIITLESEDNNLHSLEQLYQKTKDSIAKAESSILAIGEEIGRLEAEVKTLNAKWTFAKDAASAGLVEWVRERLFEIVGEITLEDLSEINYRQDSAKKELESQHSNSNQKRNEADKTATRIMSTYRAHDSWRIIAEDWGVDMISVDNYLNHLQSLLDDGLPGLEDRFINKLNQDSAQSIASIRQKIESEYEDIKDRIETINDVLFKTEFRDGTYLRLVTRREEFEHVKIFNSKVRDILSATTANEPIQRYNGLHEIVSILEKAAILSPRTEESRQLLEPRYQLRFLAEEIRRSDRERIDTLTSSSGKSGGEKESFAGIIVAASLAYVLTPDGADKPIYSTVFLDEAFSNTSEMVSRRVLKVFKELNIHINLITPYKNINIARESARSLLIAERNSDTHESKFIEITWEEADKLQRERENNTSTAESLGIKLGG